MTSRPFVKSLGTAAGNPGPSLNRLDEIVYLNPIMPIFRPFLADSPAGRVSQSGCWGLRVRRSREITLGVLPFLLIGLSVFQDVAVAQGTLANGDNVNGSISRPGQVDSWTFQANAGDAIAVSVSEAGNNTNYFPQIQLISPDGTSLGVNWGDIFAKIKVSAPLGGIYTVLISRHDPYTVTGNYLLTLAKAPGSFIVPSGDEGGPMANGGNYSGVIFRGDLDLWSFTANKGDAVAVSISETGTNTNFFPQIQLIDPTGKVLDTNWGDLFAKIKMSAPTTGTYTVLVDRHDPDGVAGSYVLTLAQVPEAFIVPSGDEGGPMVNGGNYSGVVSRGDLDLWTFQANPGDTVAVSISETGTNTNFFPQIQLIDPNGKVLDTNWGDLFAKIKVSAQVKGTYTVLVDRHDTSDATGNYLLTLAQVPEPFTVPSGDQGGMMMNGGNYPGVIVRGDLDLWSFQANAGDAIAVSISETGANTNFFPQIQLIDRNGTVLATNWGDLFAKIKVSAQVSGTYTVLVDRHDTSDATGNYLLALAKAPGSFIVPSGDEGGAMTNGGNYSGAILRGDLDLWSFQASGGNQIALTITETGANTNFFPEMQLISPNGTILATNWGDVSAKINVAAPLDGTYTVRVDRHDTSDGTGNYGLTVSGITSPQTMSGKLLSCGWPGSVQDGNPCDIATGNKIEQVTDYTTASLDRLAFIRSYNSLAISGPATFAFTLGVNWRSNYDRYVRIVSASSAAVERPDGRILNFALQNGFWTPDTDVDLKLSQTGSGVGSTWTLTDGSDSVETYTTISATEAVLNAIRARNGYTQSLQYDGNNRLTIVTDSFGRSLQFTYQNGLLQSLSTPDSLVLTYSYAAAGSSNRLVSVAYNTSPQTSQSYVYENASFPFALTGILDEDGNRFATWTYDTAGRATSSQHAGGADLTQFAYNADGSRTVTDPLGQQTVYKFTTLQGIPKVTEEDRLATSTTAAATQTFTYDATGYVASQADWNGNLTTYVNDAHGQPTSITEAVGTPQARTTAISWDATFHLPTKIVEPGITTDLAYDASGNLLTRTLTDTTTTTVPYSTNSTKRTWTYTWGTFGLLASVKGPRTDVAELTGFGYDSSGTLIRITNALGQLTQVTQHTPGGLPQTIVDANGVATQLAYDARLRLTSSTINTGAGALTTSYAYDAAGNLLSVTLPDGSKLANGYDAAHRLTSVTNLFSEKTAYILDALGDRTLVNVTNASNVVKRTRSDAFDALGRLARDAGGAGQVTKYAYDNNGNALTIADALNRVTSQAFDPLNRLFRVTDAENGVATTAFDAHDRPLTVTAPNGAVTSYVYDGFGDLIQASSPDTGKTIYRYDLAGNLTQKVDAAGATTNYTYDALDRALTTTYPADAAENVAYVYDQAGHGFGIGRLTSVTDAVGSLSRSYDERGNLLTESRAHGGVTLLTSYAYDAASRIASIAYPSGAKATYARDAMGRIAGVTMTPKTGSAQTVASAIGYQPFGPVAGFTFGNGLIASRAFDLDYRLTNLAEGGIQNLTYGYNAANDVLTIADGVHSGSSQTLGYDALDRLTSATGAYGSLAYTYDLVGNRLTQQAGATSTTYTYTPQSNRLTQIRTGSSPQALAYTAAGNIASIATIAASVTSARPATTIAYNQANRLARVLSGGQQTMQYSYDAFGQRLVKIGTATGTTLSQYDQGGHLLEQADGSGNAQVDYIYLGDRPLATFQPSNGKLYFLHDDRLGTPQAATDSGQSIVWNATYEPFGATSTGIGVIAQDLRLPGQEFEVETGWNHNGFRDYAPTLGRYLESDPIGLRGGVNIYGYVSQNPAKNIDRSGLKPGDRFSTAQEAACDVLTYIDPKSIDENREYYGTIRIDQSTGQFYATYPQPGDETGATGRIVDKIDVGAYHTHGDYSKADKNGNAIATGDVNSDDFNSDQFSTQDLQLINKHNRADPAFTGYLGTPSGIFWQYNPHEKPAPTTCGCQLPR